MLSRDKVLLTCDLAETYGIYDYRAHEPMLIASLVAGLRENSRIKQKQLGPEADKQGLLLAVIADLISAQLLGEGGTTWIDWFTGEKPQEKQGELASFDTPEEYEAARSRIIKG